LMNNI